MENNKKRFECDCSIPEHCVRVDYYDDEDQLYIYISKTKLPFIKRLLKGFKYIFNLEERFYYDEVVLDKDKAQELNNFISDFVNK